MILQYMQPSTVNISKQLDPWFAASRPISHIRPSPYNP